MAPTSVKALILASLCAVSGAGGYFVSKLVPQTNSFQLGLFKLSNPIGAGSSLACVGVGTAALYERPFYPKQVEGSLGAGQDKASIKIAADGRSLQLLTAASVEVGHTDAGTPIPIVAADEGYIFAVSTENQETDTLLIDRKKRRVIWSVTKVNPLIGMIGQTIFFDCY